LRAVLILPVGENSLLVAEASWSTVGLELDRGGAGRGPAGEAVGESLVLIRADWSPTAEPGGSAPIEAATITSVRATGGRIDPSQRSRDR
jgi:hypothetical protein